MYSNYQNNLFRRYRLDDYLRTALQSLKSKINDLSSEELDTNEVELIETLLKKYSLSTPVLHEDNIRINPRESQITIKPYQLSRIDNFMIDEDITVKGIVVDVSIPFTGDQQLFQCMPSTYSLSGTPNAEIKNGEISLHYETTDKDPEKIKNLWVSDIQVIKQNLEWIKNDIDKHNSILENTIRPMITERKKESDNNQSLIEKLKQL